ncbi:MAG: leucyl aminopeptidase family protein [Thermoanaerobaculaceae bacterium]|nr:leucyl aminopeptidase family protein [Thermoanaerobaculaceae bacterium]
MADLLQYRSAPEDPLDCLYLAVAAGQKPLAGLDLPGSDRARVAKTLDELGVRGLEGEVLVTASPVRSFHRLACFGIGKAEAFNVLSLRKLLRRVLEQAGRNHEYQIAVGIPVALEDVEEGESRAVVLAELALADYRFDRFRSRPDESTKVDGVHVVPLAGESEEELGEKLAVAQRVDSLVRLARDLGNRPPNDLTPAVFAAELQSLFAGSAVRVTAMGAKELQKEGLRGILAAGAGSGQEPRLVRLEYRAKKPKRAVVLVGKGMTLDAGGFASRPWREAAESKYDVAGAAAVVAAMKTVAEDEPPLKVVGLLPIVEAMPSGTALRPGDILALANGTTVEVGDAHADGRLLVADALAYAAHFHPQVMVDLAGLSGGCAEILGHEIAGMFSNDDALAAQLSVLGRRTGDRVWRLPLPSDTRGVLESDRADLRSTPLVGGSLPASAAFLHHFVPEGVSWAHLDLAGVGHLPFRYNGLPAGATGFGVRLLTRFLRELAESA